MQHTPRISGDVCSRTADGREHAHHIKQGQLSVVIQVCGLEPQFDRLLRLPKFILRDITKKQYSIRNVQFPVAAQILIGV